MQKLSRRRFPGKTALAAAALSAPIVRSLRAGEPGPNDKIRLGLIGCGGMGQGDLQCFLLNPEVECSVICDVKAPPGDQLVGVPYRQRWKLPYTRRA
ncbi:MAG: hypothetical protein ABSG59_19340 [Verrucomicrobiota bacterium]|jgi:hypothetical protein